MKLIPIVTNIESKAENKMSIYFCEKSLWWFKQVIGVAWNNKISANYERWKQLLSTKDGFRNCYWLRVICKSAFSQYLREGAYKKYIFTDTNLNMRHKGNQEIKTNKNNKWL